MNPDSTNFLLTTPESTPTELLLDQLTYRSKGLGSPESVNYMSPLQRLSKYHPLPTIYINLINGNKILYAYSTFIRYTLNGTEKFIGK